MKRHFAIALLSCMSLGLPSLHACEEAKETDKSQSPQQQPGPIVQDFKGASTADKTQQEAKSNDSNADTNTPSQPPANGSAKG